MTTTLESKDPSKSGSTDVGVESLDVPTKRPHSSNDDLGEEWQETIATRKIMGRLQVGDSRSTVTMPYSVVKRLRDD